MKKKILASLATVAVIAGAGFIAVAGASAADEDGLNVIERVAETLGISESDLTDAFKAAQKAEIDERVEAGALDEETAEELKQKIDESDDVFFPGPHGRMGEGMGMREMDAEHQEALAEFLGMTVDELQAAHEDGQRMPELLESSGKTREELHDFMTEKFGEDFEPRGPRPMDEE